MRRLVVAGAALIIVMAIALLVRPEVRDSTPMREVPVAAGPNRTDPPVATVEQESEDPVITSVTRPISTPAQTPAARRPVISEQIDQLESPENLSSGGAMQEGAAILKRASAAYTKIKSMRADFVQRRENPLLNSTNTSRGTLYQRRPDRFALKFSQPAGDVIVADGRYFWVYYPSADKRQVIRADAGAAGAGAVDLQSQFIGDPVKRFSHTYHGTEKQGGRTLHVLTLVPRQNAGYKSMKVWIDGGDALVRRFQITEQTGALVEFQLSNLSVNPALGDEIFRFTPPAGAQVIER
jgi:outer membrane lipoprotein carrier protein